MAVNKEKVEEKKAQLLQLTGDFCKDNLNEEYRVVIEKLIGKMARKKDVPFATGKIEIWAAAIIHAPGMVNFLFDKATNPYVSVIDVCNYFGTKQSTTTQKSKKIRDMFDMTYFDSNFSTESIEQDNPLNNLTMVNGLLAPQDMVEMQEEVELDDWELRVAEILGASIQGKNESELSELLEVTNANLRRYYHYLQNHLAFPFRASYEEETGPLSVTEYDVNCLRLDQEMEYEEFYGVLLECRHGRKKVIVALAEIDVDEENRNFGFIDDYQAWFWNYH